jgi:hypothetical protein
MRQCGNAVVHAEPAHETSEAFYFTHHFVDLETNVAVARQWREDKRSQVDGKMDEERKMAIRFNRGQSKNMRNVILSAMPEWLVHKAIEEAKGRVRRKIERFVEEKSLAAAQKYVVDQLKRLGVTEAQILAKTMRDKVEGLDVDDIVQLSGDLKSIQHGAENAANLFPAGRAEPAKMDLKDKLKSQAMAAERPIAHHAVQSTPKPEPPAERQVTDITVKPGKQPFTYDTNDGMQEYLTSVDGDQKSCNCGHKPSGACAHVAAVERFAQAVH